MSGYDLGVPAVCDLERRDLVPLDRGVPPSEELSESEESSLLVDSDRQGDAVLLALDPRVAESWDDGWLVLGDAVSAKLVSDRLACGSEGATGCPSEPPAVELEEACSAEPAPAATGCAGG